MLISKITNSPNFRGKVLMDREKVKQAIEYTIPEYHEALQEGIKNIKESVEKSTPDNAYYLLDVRYRGGGTIDGWDYKQGYDGRRMEDGLYLSLTNAEKHSEQTSGALKLKLVDSSINTDYKATSKDVKDFFADFIEKVIRKSLK